MSFFQTAAMGIAAAVALGLAAGEAGAEGYERGRSIKDTTSPGDCCQTHWGGLYVGAAAGYGLGTMRVVDADVSYPSLKGAQGSVALGYDLQLKPGLVLGAFADYTFGAVDTTFSLTTFSFDNQWSIGARLGVVRSCCTLWYGMAGYTQADFRISEEGRSLEETMKGYFVGLGVEQALSKNVSLKLEYRYSDYDDVTVLGVAFDNEAHAIRLGANWKLGR
jgi:opacity protein-like surface antigen